MRKNPLEVFLFRHPPVAIQEKICYGQTDLDLNSVEYEGWKSRLAGQIEKSIANEKSIDAPSEPSSSFIPGAQIMSSPLRRCLEPAGYIASKLSSHPPVVVPEFMEMNFGRWEMIRWDELKDDPRLGYAHWTEDWVNNSVLDGESFVHLKDRVVGKFTAIIDESLRNESGDLVIVTHAGPIRAILSHILSIPLEMTFRIEIRYGSMTKIKFKGEIPIVEAINKS